MKKLLLLLLFSQITLCQKISYPYIAQELAIDSYHDSQIADHYRNIENLENPSVIKWMKSQNNLSDSILTLINGRNRLISLQEDIDKSMGYEIWNIRETYNHKLFYLKMNSNESFPSLYFRTAFDKEEKLLFKTKKFNDSTGHNYHINSIQPDWLGDRVAISLAKEGEEISKIIFLNIKTLTIEPVILENAKQTSGGIQWLPDNSGIIYFRFINTDPQKSNYGFDSESVFYKLGDPVNNIIPIFSKNSNPEVNLKEEDYPKINIPENYSNYIFGKVSGSSKFKTYYYKKIKDAVNNHKPWEILFESDQKIEQFFIKENSLIYLTAKDASNYEIRKVNLKKLNFDQPEIIISQDDNAVITDMEVTKDGIYFVRVKNGVEASLYLYKFIDETYEQITVPENPGQIEINSFGLKFNHLTVYTESWITPSTRYSYIHEQQLFINQKIMPEFNFSGYDNLMVEEVEITSHDNTKVPVSIIRPKNLKFDGNNHTIFYGYGSYGNSAHPYFSPHFLLWVREGGILVFAHVRGGGEKGKNWYLDGNKVNKPNTWKDIIATTKYMIHKGYTKPEKSAVWGSSAGGIMAGRAMTDEPDLYSAVILTSPAMNMLRSEFQPNGKNSIKEFGTVKIKEEFEALLEMDSYHNLQPKTDYPATLVTGGFKDGRVVIWDPAKFVAKLQKYNTSNNPILFQVDFNAGHNTIGGAVNKRHLLYANTYAFAFWQTGHPAYQVVN